MTTFKNTFSWFFQDINFQISKSSPTAILQSAMHSAGYPRRASGESSQILKKPPMQTKNLKPQNQTKPHHPKTQTTTTTPNICSSKQNVLCMGVWFCHMQASKNKERSEKYKAYKVILEIRGIAPISGGILFTNCRCIHTKYTVILFPRKNHSWIRATSHMLWNVPRISNLPEQVDIIMQEHAFFLGLELLGNKVYYGEKSKQSTRPPPLTDPMPTVADQHPTPVMPAAERSPIPRLAFWSDPECTINTLELNF